MTCLAGAGGRPDRTARTRAWASAPRRVCLPPGLPGPPPRRARRLGSAVRRRPRAGARALPRELRRRARRRPRDRRRPPSSAPPGRLSGVSGVRSPPGPVSTAGRGGGFFGLGRLASPAAPCRGRGASGGERPASRRGRRRGGAGRPRRMGRGRGLPAAGSLGCGRGIFGGLRRPRRARRAAWLQGGSGRALPSPGPRPSGRNRPPGPSSGVDALGVQGIIHSPLQHWFESREIFASALTLPPLYSR